jgi:hypothetical protein
VRRRASVDQTIGVAGSWIFRLGPVGAGGVCVCTHARAPAIGRPRPSGSVSARGPVRAPASASSPARICRRGRTGHGWPCLSDSHHELLLMSLGDPAQCRSAFEEVRSLHGLRPTAIIERSSDGTLEVPDPRPRTSWPRASAALWNACRPTNSPLRCTPPRTKPEKPRPKKAKPKKTSPRRKAHPDRAFRGAEIPDGRRLGARPVTRGRFCRGRTPEAVARGEQEAVPYSCIPVFPRSCKVTRPGSLSPRGS